MQDESREDVVIDLIAKSLDEPLTPAEQAQVDAALENSLALRLASEGLYEFDLLLKRTGMAIPVEGFPLRVLARLEAYERRRTRTEWLLTLGIIFLGSVVAVAWGVLDSQAILDAVVQGAALFALALPLFAGALWLLVQMGGQIPLLLLSLLVLVLTIVWVRVSGGTAPAHATH